MLEDESGRLRLTGNALRSTHLVTGVIIAALGTETSNGDFDVIDIKVPDFPPQPKRWERATSDKMDSKLKQASSNHDTKGSSKIALVSGLGVTGSSTDSLALDLLTDYLLGYTGDDREDDISPTRISRLIIAGNSLVDAEVPNETNTDNPEAGVPKKKQVKKYGYDASAYNPSPITQLDAFLSEILPSIPVTLMPGETDPANVALPQQGIHRAMLPRARLYCSDGDSDAEPGWFDSVTNPWEGYVDGWRLWGCSGQNVDDVLRYLDFADEDGYVDAVGTDGETRLRIMEAMLRWRCAVPTAPDTLCKSPFNRHPMQNSNAVNRVLSFPITRPFYLTSLPPFVLCRQPDTIQKCHVRRRLYISTGWARCSNARCLGRRSIGNQSAGDRNS
jgi:DNA polymerase delta subunit 2